MRSGLLGIQPFKQILRDDDRAVITTGRRLGFDACYVARVANGYVAPTDELQHAMSQFLHLPVTDLFTPEAISAQYLPRKNARGLRKPQDGGQ